MKKLMVIIALLGLSYDGAFCETGWFRIERGHSLYFKPFIEVKSAKDRMVLFITSDGKVYKGKCRKKTIKDFCSITPGKKFPDNTESIRYIILKLRKFYAPEIVKTGIINNLNIKDKL